MELDSMCISNKLKTLRKIKKITQSQLSDLTGIHLISIKKYETDKMKPERHIKELSSGLNISSICLLDDKQQHFYRLQTIGDIYALIINLIKQEIIIINGQKDNQGRFLANTIELSINSIITSFLSNETIQKIQIDDLEILKNLSEWEYLKNNNQDTELEYFELQLFSQDIPLNSL